MDAEQDWELEPRLVTVPAVDGAAGLVYQLPGAVSYEILAFSFSLVATADAANRQVVAKLLDQTGKAVFAEAAPAVQTAGATVEYSFAGDRQPFGTLALGLMGGGFVRGRLPQNMAVAVTVGSAHAGDLIGDIRLLVHQVPITRRRTRA